jgi:hypothetical protein
MRIHAMTLGAFLFGGILPLAPSLALAQAGQSVSAEQLASEYKKLRADLDEVNGEVAALKQAERSVRNDYRIRDKMAQAEALARKVTDAEARLRAARGPSSAENPSGPVEPPVVATPQDSALELEAKADLLSDQARRFKAEADALAHTAGQIRARQALRRRAGAWDRDPLAGFESSKRATFIVSQASKVAAGGESNNGASSGAGAPERGGGGTTLAIGATGSQGAVGAAGSGTKSSGTNDTAGATPVIAPPVSNPTAMTPVTAPGGAGPVVSVTASGSPSPSRPLTAVTAPSSTPESASKAAALERPLLDPTALAAIRSNLSQAGSLSDPEAAEAAVAALRKHAQALDEQARRLRARAGQR